jgi:hypothetical protein
MLDDGLGDIVEDEILVCIGRNISELTENGEFRSAGNENSQMYSCQISCLGEKSEN